VTKEEHKSIAVDFASFMGGNDVRFVSDLERKMKAASGDLDYEAAARYRDQLSAMRMALSKNDFVLPDDVDADFFGIAHDELAAAVQQFIVRGGRIRGVKSWVVDKELDVELAELIETVLQNAYEDEGVPPREVVVPVIPDDSAELEQWLTNLRVEAGEGAGRVALKTAQRGDKASLALTVATNAKNALMLYKTRRSGDFVARSQALADIQEALDMQDAPLRMECYDVSHLSGTNIVASMVVFEDGLPRKDQYRRFSIPESTDDTESIYQTLSRRLAHLDQDAVRHEAEESTADAEDEETGRPRKRFAYRPNLLIVDGGQPQVAAAKRALEGAGVATSGPGGITLVGIAKRLEELWLPDSDYPVILPRNSDALFMIQRIRDEAHRFAITYQRQRRSSDISSSLADIPGLGPTRVKELLKHFGSVTRLRAADADAIGEVKGVGPVLAKQIYERLRS
jgi:excinuclease ABC subunit C